MKKRIFSFVLAVLMIASLLPATALAAVKSGTCGAEGDGSNLTWTLDAMKDAVAINAISGVTVDGRLYIQPARNATRAEAAKILMMFHETMTK